MLENTSYHVEQQHLILTRCFFLSYQSTCWNLQYSSTWTHTYLLHCKLKITAKAFANRTEKVISHDQVARSVKHVKRGSISVNASKGFNVEVQVKQLCQLSYQQLSLLSETKELKIHIHVYIFNSLQKPKAIKICPIIERIKSCALSE